MSSGMPLMSRFDKIPDDGLWADKGKPILSNRTCLANERKIGVISA